MKVIFIKIDFEAKSYHYPITKSLSKANFQITKQEKENQFLSVENESLRTLLKVVTQNKNIFEAIN